ncbi:MAG TPA: type II and III secretion system protein family protein [Pseudolabrys sp.]|nr:type II and III secretion system protein family protein [Pseudolabrys sp.]
MSWVWRRVVQFNRLRICLFLGLAIAGLGAAGAQTSVTTPQGPARITVDEAATRRISVPQNKSRTVRFDRAFASTVIGLPEIADVLALSDRVVYIQAKKIGTTNVSVFDADKHLVAVLDVEVTVDTQTLAAQIRESTGVSGIKVGSSNGQIVLSGEARDAVVADRAVQIAKATTPTTAVINAMRVAASQQVMLKVRFLEVTRTAERDLGVNWFVANGSGTRGFNTGLGAPSQVGQSPAATPGGIPLFQALSTFAGGTTGAPFGVALANLVNNNNARVDLMITALEDKGLIRRLAEPDLVALSGDTASFLAGGEVPVPVVQPSSGASPLITVEYKPFGVQLTFMPTVTTNGIINLRLTPSVSELDFNNAVIVSGFRIPALTKREARTTIELRDGQSFAIAGLLQNDGSRNMSQVPWIGSVPVLGALFRSTSYQQNETDLVVIVTPQLVQPAAPGQRLATPVDGTLPANDVDLFLVGQSEVRKKQPLPLAKGASFQGPSGYIMPTEAK